MSPSQGNSTIKSQLGSGMASSTKTPANAGLGKDRPRALDAEGTIGKQFTEKGAIGGMAQKVGGPLDKEGMIGKQFTAEGGVGGSVQSSMGGKKPSN
ncbi:hypothetical protein GGS21DRAFT_530614 [Xylaria nigripes]|nr:hypothetical protein GGS21DRAFT_530614 [Xylaria nigripes]